MNARAWLWVAQLAMPGCGYHAALGELLLKRGKLAAAEAALSAAVLLDMDRTSGIVSY